MTTPLQDLVVFVPGILGSRLVKRLENGETEEIWNSSFRLIAKYLARRGQALQPLYNNDANDKVVPDGLIQGISLIPGLFKIDGYKKISEEIRRNFQYADATRDEKSSAGYIEFPYDWRKDNRESARLLKAKIDESLCEWRKFRPKAKVILIGHSMGGLVAKWYLENLDGHKDCRALFAVGTPFRGSVRTVNYFANGYKLNGVDVTQLMRSFPSAYQLFPTYPMVRFGKEIHTVLDASAKSGVLCGTQDDQQRIVEGIAFHKEMGGSNKTSYDVVTFVGSNQKTFQSMTITENKHWQAIYDGIGVVQPAYNHGDGVVPHYSSITNQVKLHPGTLHTFAEFHASLCSISSVVQDLIGVLRQYQASPDEPVLAEQIRPDSILTWSGLEDCYEAESAVTLSVSLSVDQDIHLQADFHQQQDEPADKQYVLKHVVDLNKSNGLYSGKLESIDPGLYRVTVRPTDNAVQYPKPLQDICVVIPSEENEQKGV